MTQVMVAAVAVGYFFPAPLSWDFSQLVNRSLRIAMHYWGMHIIWWLVWMGLFIAFFAMIDPIPRRTARVLRAQLEKPLEILRRRYAAGELTSEEYAERKAVLDREIDAAVV